MTVLDTTITTNESMDRNEIRELIYNLKGEMADLKMKLKDMDFDFKTDFPEIPECEGMWQNIDDEEIDMRVLCPQSGMFRFNYDDGPGSLNELLGNIPLECVKSYSIKDRKDGKRIIIDIDDRPMPGSREKTVIIRGTGKPAKMHYRHENPDRDVRVIIKTDKDDDKETTPTPKI